MLRKMSVPRRLDPLRSPERRESGDQKDMTTLTPTGFLTIGASNLEYRMIGPRARRRRRPS